MKHLAGFAGANSHLRNRGHPFHRRRKEHRFLKDTPAAYILKMSKASPAPDIRVFDRQVGQFDNGGFALKTDRAKLYRVYITELRWVWPPTMSVECIFYTRYKCLDAHLTLDMFIVSAYKHEYSTYFQRLIALQLTFLRLRRIWKKCHSEYQRDENDIFFLSNEGISPEMQS